MFAARKRHSSRRQAADFVDLLQSSCGWLSITPKLHILACHAADWLDYFRWLGLFAELSSDAWRGYRNQNAAVFAAGFFLQRCVRKVQRAAVSRGPGHASLTQGKRRAWATPIGRCAERVRNLRIDWTHLQAGLRIRQPPQTPTRTNRPTLSTERRFARFRPTMLVPNPCVGQRTASRIFNAGIVLNLPASKCITSRRERLF